MMKKFYEMAAVLSYFNEIVYEKYNEKYPKKNYFQKISNNNPNAKKLNDDVFFDKKKKLVVSVDTYNEGVHFPNFKWQNLN